MTLDFSFAAAGWLKTYYLGIGATLQEHRIADNARFVGSSAGALVATGLILECDFQDIYAYARECAGLVHKNPANAFRLREFVSTVIDKAINTDSFHLVNGRLQVAVTNLPGCSARRLTEFRDVAHLKRALLATSCMTPLAGFPLKLDGQWCFDGGVADFQPMFGDNDGATITVSPFYFSRADIKPSKFVPAWWALHPPRLEELDRLFNLGRMDALEWLERQGLARAAPPNSPVASPPVGRRAAAGASAAVAERPEETLQERLAQHACVVDFDDPDAVAAALADATAVDPVPDPKIHYHVRHRPSSMDLLQRRVGKAVHTPETPLETVESGFLDLLVLALMFVIIKPIAFTLLYLELIARAAFHICTGGWADWYQVTRSAVSGRMMARAIVGRSVPMNTERLLKHSFIYRFFAFHL